MLVQIYEVSCPEEASALSEIGVDHVGVLVGNGAFPREQPIQNAIKIFAGIRPPSKGSALSLSPSLDLIEQIVRDLQPPILHLGASIELLRPDHVKQLKQTFPSLVVMRSIPVFGQESVTVAKSYDEVADILLLDTYRPGAAQIGALGVTHCWELDKRINDSVSTPVIIAGGLGPDNVVAAIRATSPAGVDSKTKTDKDDGSHTKDPEKVRLFAHRAKSVANPAESK